MTNPPFRIEIPTNAEDRIQLGMSIYNRHVMDGAASPLHLQQDYNWSQHGPNLQEALQLHQQAELLRRQMEEAYEQRDRLLGNIDEAIRSSRDLLKGIYRSQPHKLGNWGFNVNDTPPASQS
ncbi:MAG: hypothetical protein EOP52_06710 [Sphingobacteriales bacterium]|nr:MAG: hypothetical protein EOP52_06710 [Sphingobacteriales bacterium]